jgi:hypothetical protein
MKKISKISQVVLLAVTVCFFVKDQRVGFLDATGVIFWVDLIEAKSFSKMAFSEGLSFWIYVAKEKSKVIAVVPHQGEAQADMPGMDPVEVA